MLLTPPQRLLFSSANFLFPSHSPFPFRRSLNFPVRRTNQYSSCSAHKSWIALLSEQLTTTAITDPYPPEDGPVELPSIPPIFASDDDPTPLQTATSVLLTGAVTIFLFRSLRRRAKRAKETKFRSSGEKKSLTEEAMDSLKSVTLLPSDTSKSSPSPVQAFLGAFSAGVIALILYKFTTTVEASLNRQTIPDNYSVRQITITIRTIINGICYLATFVFGINSLGLLLYSGQLAFNSFMEDSDSESEAPSSSSGTDSSGITSTSEDQGSDDIE